MEATQRVANPADMDQKGLDLFKKGILSLVQRERPPFRLLASRAVSRGGERGAHDELSRGYGGEGVAPGEGRRCDGGTAVLFGQGMAEERRTGTGRA